MTERKVYPWGKLPPIRIYNSLTRREETFPCASEHPEVSIYVCGPTTYALVHIGNMRNPVFYDVVRKIFLSHGYRVRYVTNFTDIDDKMIDEASKVGEDDPIQLSAKFVHEYYTDLFALGVDRADFYPKVSSHINDIIEYIILIMDKGHAYVGGDDSVYFDTTSYPDYLKLSGHDFDKLLENIDQGEELDAKRDPRDFALWKAAKPGEPTWPFTSDKYKVADGRPGWHIECSVMSAKYLGESFDIHGGGKELKFPHHENEIAQAKCGHPDADFARIWMHNEWVVLPSGEKMAKSGESILIRDVLKKYDPDLVRMFLLSAHYRKDVEYSSDRLVDQDKAKARLVEVFNRLTEFLRWRAEERYENWLLLWDQFDHDYSPNSLSEVSSILEKFEDGLKLDDMEWDSPAWYMVNAAREALFLGYRHMAADFDTQGAIGELFKLVSRVNSSLDKMESGDSNDFNADNIALGAIVHLTEIFGVLKKERDSLYATVEARMESGKGGGDAAKLADVLLKIRDNARADKNFATADMIRDMLKEIGAEVRDSDDGPRIVWK